MCCFFYHKNSYRKVPKISDSQGIGKAPIRKEKGPVLLLGLSAAKSFVTLKGIEQKE